MVSWFEKRKQIKKIKSYNNLKEFYNSKLDLISQDIVIEIEKFINSFLKDPHEASIQTMLYLWSQCQYHFLSFKLTEHSDTYGIKDVRFKRLMIQYLFELNYVDELTKLLSSPDYKGVKDPTIKNIIKQLRRHNLPIDDNKKTCITWGFTKKGSGVTFGLKQISEKQILTVSTNHSHVNFFIRDLLNRKDFLNILKHIDIGPTIIVSKKLHKDFVHFSNLLSRYTFETHNYDYGLRDFSSLDHLFDLYYTFFNYLIDKNNVDIVVFSNMPHQGADYMLYCVARDRKIKIKILFQSLIPGRFFEMDYIEDFGLWETSSKRELTDEDTKLAREMSVPKIVDFATNVKHKTAIDNPISRYRVKRELVFPNGYQARAEIFEEQTYHPYREILRYRSFLAEGSCRSVINAFKTMYRFFRLSKIVAYRQPPINHFWTSEKVKFLFNSMDIERPKLNLESTKYIYFAMHYQPELTTSALGGEFTNQMDAIEKISALAGDEYKIFVKENPKQEDYMRPEEFYYRAKKLNNVTFVPIETQTSELMKHSQAVATISGTVGYEAIIHLKKVITFGYAWYATAPNVLHVDKIPTHQSLKDFINFKMHSTEDIVDYFQDILRKMQKGVLGEPYQKLVEDHDEQKNAKQIADYLKTIVDF